MRNGCLVLVYVSMTPHNSNIEHLVLPQLLQSIRREPSESTSLYTNMHARQWLVCSFLPQTVPGLLAPIIIAPIYNSSHDVTVIIIKNYSNIFGSRAVFASIRT